MKTPPAETSTENRFENPTGIQIKQSNKTLKQQSTEAAAVSSLKEREVDAAAEILRREGFDQATAERLANRYAIERITEQIEWIDRRSVKRNRLGMLRLAIEQDWGKPSPAGKQLGRPNFAAEKNPGFAEQRDQLLERFRQYHRR